MRTGHITFTSAGSRQDVALPQDFDLGVLRGRDGVSVSLDGINSRGQHIGIELDIDAEDALAAVLVVRPVFPEDGAMYDGRPGGLVTYPFDYATHWRGWRKAGSQQTKTVDGKYGISSARKTNGALELEAARTAEAEMNASSRVTLTLRSDSSNPAEWRDVTVHLVIQTALPATTYVADFAVRRAEQ